MTGLLYAKPRPKLLDKRQKASQIGEIDRRQRSLCHQRSGMKCEVFTELGRCGRRVSENHHLIGGIGRRNRGKSLLAAHRLDCCDRCHHGACAGASRHARGAGVGGVSAL
jgi:hypothetical protein